jgi:hypothetical protein
VGIVGWRKTAASQRHEARRSGSFNVERCRSVERPRRSATWTVISGGSAAIAT